MTDLEPVESADTPGGRWKRPGRFLRDLNIVALLALITAAAALFMSPRSDDVLLGLPDLALGDRSPRTIRSPRALTIVDPVHTKALQADAERNVLPVYDQDVRLVEEAELRVESAFRILTPNELAESDEERADIRESFAAALGLVLRARTIDAIMAGPPDELRDAVLSVLSVVGEQPIVARARELPPGVDQLTVLQLAPDERPVQEILVDDLSQILTLDQARAKVDALAAERLGHLPRPQRRAAAVIAKELLEDNLERNTSETRRRQRLARDSVKPVFIAIKPGEVVVRGGAPVDEQKLRILQGMEDELNATSRVQVTTGSALLVMLLVIFAYRLAARAHGPRRPAPRDITFWATAVLLTLLSLWAGYHGVAFVIDFTRTIPVETLRMGLPVAFGVLLIRLVTGAQAAAVFTPVAAVMAGWMMDASLSVAVYTVAGGLAAASLPDGERLTRLLFIATSRIIVAQTTVACAFELFESNLHLTRASELLAVATVSSLSSVILASICLAAAEAVFGYATSLRLGQLANLNHPLLKQLLVEAPGTYHHSIMVGTLAEAAAKSIGASGVLARVGGYYHDIGKLKNPRAFDENDGREVGPAESTAHATELRAHVADGVELAHQHRLGASVIDILRQHHGTSGVRRRSAKVRQPQTDIVTYEGPRPLAREAGLVMLADNVEAATRHLDKEVVVERDRIESAVADAVQIVVQDGQLDESELSLYDLDRTRQAFVQVLEARFSRRGRPLTSLPEVTGAPLVRAPTGEPN